MGYAAQDKGFFFLLEALEDLPHEVSSTIVLKIASKIDNKRVLERIEMIKGQFHDVVLYDGYNHTDFPAIMKDVNLGIVPPQWEDNLPQVTIEMISNGVPVLASNNGGAHELNRHPSFVFTDKLDFQQKLQAIIYNRSLLIDYWDNSESLTTMERHWKQLMHLYQCNS